MEFSGKLNKNIVCGNTIFYDYNAKATRNVGKPVWGNVSMEETFTYDVIGRITGSVMSGSRPEFVCTAAYGYDAAGQLVFCRNGEAVELMPVTHLAT